MHSAHRLRRRDILQRLGASVGILGFGLLALYLASRVRLDRLVRAAPLLIFLGLGLLLAVRAIGVTSNGGKRWLNLHAIYLQPSELFKLCTVLFIAWLVQHYHDELGHWRQLAVWTVPVTFGCAQRWPKRTPSNRARFDEHSAGATT